ncbi:MAG: class I SAM-dependent methyltransferase [Mesorhizobium sp.]|uniref:class I SAM-dependent methyltransferase n=1 Tax=Mesorhizobium sp. M8A.F.Ca.ET.207.01.1.1 TaxID=2563968 RepID=UPI00109C2840|nr:class I SAM-dependent methyltransferase [Mesorhizobium sp. M8A.F.Ca.ET.207.01.1.1]TGQ79500.1 class I SAM-dependent methyltransferase [Mesorhizobium sp. M8A.F.Ca.ET.207.01.1.1]TIT64577.1 MAG: class I SAM-dependent methyltransferase [Mesorhizobium sp.]
MYKLFDQSQFFRGSKWDFDIARANKTALEKYQSFYSAMELSGLPPYDLDRITTAIFYLRTMLIRHGMTGQDKTAVEIGCGTGNKSLSINDLFGRYIGIDLLKDQIHEANRRARSLRQENLFFVAENAVRVLKNPSAFGIPDEIDLLVLYAVIEHLTPTERADVLALADDVIGRGGHVLIMESPNRLLPFDSHTTEAHFFNWLPDRLAFEFAKTEAKRSEIVAEFDSWSGERSTEQLYRIGRGVSFHDLEQVFSSDLVDYSFPMHSFCCETLNMEPIQHQEINLLGYLSRNVPGKPNASFARAWIDTIIGGHGSETSDVRYLSPFWPLWLVHEEPPIFWQSPSKTLSSQSAQWEAEPNIEGASEIAFCFTGETAEIAIEIKDCTSDRFELVNLTKARPTRWHNSFSVAYKVDKPLTHIRVRCLSGSVQFNGAFVSVKSQRPTRRRPPAFRHSESR